MSVAVVIGGILAILLVNNSLYLAQSAALYEKLQLVGSGSQANAILHDRGRWSECGSSSVTTFAIFSLMLDMIISIVDGFPPECGKKNKNNV